MSIQPATRLHTFTPAMLAQVNAKLRVQLGCELAVNNVGQASLVRDAVVLLLQPETTFDQLWRLAAAQVFTPTLSTTH